MTKKALEGTIEEPVKAGGGVYVYRTRKPMSLIGKLRLPGWSVIPASIAAGVAGELLGISWWVTAPAGLFITGRHFAYVGETTAFRNRHRQHMGNVGTDDTYQHAAKPWADLDPRCVARIRLPRWKWLLRSVETIFMLLLWPVYNHKKNLWNPRRIPLDSQRRQRFAREGRKLGISWNLRAAHIVPPVWALIGAWIG